VSVPLATTPMGDALAAATDALAAAGVQTPRLDAELLLAEATGRDRARLSAEPEAPIEPHAGRAFAEMVRRRLRREPVAYVVGRKGFHELELAVDRRALIPRPETELLVEIAVEFRPATVADVGTGCGAVALAIAAELPHAEVTATDSSAEALELARENAARVGLADRVRFEAALAPPRRFELLVANLPYVHEHEWERLEPEITRFEPREALVAGADGLDAITALVEARPACDAIALEVGEGQAPRVAELVRDAGFGSVELRRDLAGIDRVVLGRRL
jgi:release factor glutamine methyltransferase